MKLRSVQVREFKSVWDSGPFDVDRVTCLVGKNEAGKTALLQALYRLNPIVVGEGEYDVTDDYPRSEVEDYQQDVEAGRRDPAIVVDATFSLEDAQLKVIREHFGEGALSKPEVVVSKGYTEDNSGGSDLRVVVPVDEPSIVEHLVVAFELPSSVAKEACKKPTLKVLSQYLQEIATEGAGKAAEAKKAAQEVEDEAEKATALEKAKALEESEQVKALRGKLEELLKSHSIGSYIWQKFLKPDLPLFLYFDDYYQLRGHDNVEALKQRLAEGKGPVRFPV